MLKITCSFIIHFKFFRRFYQVLFIILVAFFQQKMLPTSNFTTSITDLIWFSNTQCVPASLLKKIDSFLDKTFAYTPFPVYYKLTSNNYNLLPTTTNELVYLFNLISKVNIVNLLVIISLIR